MPTCPVRPPKSLTDHAIEKRPNPTMDDQERRGDGMAQRRTGLGDAWVDKSAAIPNHGSFGLLNPDDQVGNIVTGKTRIDVTANNFNVVANPSVHALRQQIDHSCSLKAAFNMHKAANIR